MATRRRLPVCVYVLALADGKWYVGKTRRADPQARIAEHFASPGDARGQRKGSAWTQLHRPLAVEAIHPDCDDFDEDKHTKRYMAHYGIENVRGGAYCRTEIDPRTQEFLRNEIRAAQDMCFSCGGEGHYASSCEGAPPSAVPEATKRTRPEAIRSMRVLVSAPVKRGARKMSMRSAPRDRFGVRSEDVWIALYCGAVLLTTLLGLASLR